MKKSAFLAFLLSLMIFAVALDVPFEPAASAEPHGGHLGGGHGGGFHRGGHFEGGIWFGPGWGFWDPLYYPYYPYYAPPATIVPQQPEEYILPAPQRDEAGYWYYCKGSRGYYPYVNRCPGGWLRVLPSTPPGQDEEE